MIRTHERSLVRLWRGCRRLRGGLARLEVDVDPGAIAGAAVFDARDAFAEPTDELRQLRIERDLRAGRELLDLGERDARREHADARELAAADPDRHRELWSRDRAEAVEHRGIERRAGQRRERARDRGDLVVDGVARHRELELGVRVVTDRLREP